MAKNRSRNMPKYRLLAYYQMGHRMRTLPFLVAFLCLVMLLFGWSAHTGIAAERVNLDILLAFWEGRYFLVAAVAACVVMYIIAVIIARRSFVQLRPMTMRIQAGLFRMDVAYKRIQKLRLVQVGMQYPPSSLRGRDRAIIEPLQGMTATAVDLKSWPVKKKLLQRLWSKFMFSPDGDSILLMVEEPIVLNQQIDNRIQQYKDRSNPNQGYLDPIDRAFQQGRRRL
jgi:hypothetical protein